MDNVRVLLTIAARGGSKGVPDKNIRNVAGKPLIAHTIGQALNWGKADRIVCSTDSEKIAAVAREYGALTPFIRPAELASDTAGKLGVLRHAWLELERVFQERFDVLIDLDVTAPLRRGEDIDGAFRMFCEQRPDSVVSAVPARRSPYFNMLELQPDGFVALPKRLAVPVLRRQDAPKVYDMNASIYVYARDFLLNPCTKSAVEGKTLVWLMPEETAFDIDTEADIEYLEFLMHKGRVSL